jgi:hypothetical protein
MKRLIDLAKLPDEIEELQRCIASGELADDELKLAKAELERLERKDGRTR